MSNMRQSHHLPWAAGIVSSSVWQCGCGLQHHCCCVGKWTPSLGRNGNLRSSKDLRHPKSRVFYATISAWGCPGMAFRDVIELAVSIRVQLHFALGTCSVHPVDRWGNLRFPALTAWVELVIVGGAHGKTAPSSRWIRLWELLGAILCQFCHPTVGPVRTLVESLSQDPRPFASHVLRRHRSRLVERSSVAEWNDLPRCSQTSGFRLRFYITYCYVVTNLCIIVHLGVCRFGWKTG